jgi:hypothetical protein
MTVCGPALSGIILIERDDVDWNWLPLRTKDQATGYAACIYVAGEYRKRCHKILYEIPLRSTLNDALTLQSLDTLRFGDISKVGL